MYKLMLLQTCSFHHKASVEEVMLFYRVSRLTWWPLPACPVYLPAIILSSIMHSCAWLPTATRMTWDLVCCLAVKRQSCERSWPPARGLSISILVQLCFPSFQPSSIILFLSSLFFFFQHCPLGGEWGRNGKRECSKRESERQREKTRERERCDILQGIVGTHW